MSEKGPLNTPAFLNAYRALAVVCQGGKYGKIWCFRLLLW
jgi:hypothetical protein